MICCTDCRYDGKCDLQNGHEGTLHFGCNDGEPVPETNADRIRSLSDEELTDFIVEQRFCVINPIADKLQIDMTVQHVKCRKVVLDWLKQEADV